VSVNEVTVV